MGNKKPKILMLGWEYPPFVSGGLGIATYHLVKSLREFAEVELILPDSGNSASPQNSVEFISSYSKLDCDERELSTGKKAKSKSDVLNKKANAKSVYGNDLMELVLDFTQKATEKAKTTEFDIIHAHDWMTFPAALEIQKQSKKPLAIHIHSLETDRSANPHARNSIYLIEEEAICKADLVIPVSEITKENIEKNYTENAKKIVAIYNGGDNFEKGKGGRKKEEGRKNEEERQFQI